MMVSSPILAWMPSQAAVIVAFRILMPCALNISVI